MAEGHLGDTKSLGAGLSEARIDYGPGYRLYLMKHSHQWIVLLCAGDKNSQIRDIKQARLIAKAFKENER